MVGGNQGQLSDDGAEVRRAPRRVAVSIAVLGALVMAFVVNGGMAASSATRVELQVRRDGIVRVRDGVAKLHMRIRCSSNTTGEVDGVLEQPSQHLRAARTQAVPCRRGWFNFELPFWLDHHRFVPGIARLNVTAMAGFLGDFGQTSLRMPAMLFADPRSPRN